MHLISERRRRTPSPNHGSFAPFGKPGEPPLVHLVADLDGWFSVVEEGSGFHDCPLCRELAQQPGGMSAVVEVRRESLPLIEHSGWLDGLLELAGPDAIVRVMGHEMDAPPLEELSLATFLARMGYE